MLGIGTIAGGPETRRTCLGRLIPRLSSFVEEERGDFEFGSSAAVNVVFQIAGSVLRRLEFEGLRRARYWSKEKVLMVQVAVPQAIAACKDEEAVRKFLLDSLREANGIAAKYFEKKGIEYSQRNYLALVDAVEAKFGNT